jgi:all-trans-retinol 13,14-reductase
VLDAIVIGSGMGGLSCAAALAKTGHSVLVLEQHHTLGGLTQTFERSVFRFNVGVHYIGDMGPHDHAAHVLDWLSEGAIAMASMGPVYDTVHFPGGFQIALSRPEAALKLDLTERFPGSATEIERIFRIFHEAEEAGRAVFALRSMPEAFATIYRFWKGRAIAKWCARTTQAVLEENITDPRLRAVLAARWEDYGGPPAEGAFAVHALVMRNYFGGSYYPVGGAGVFAKALAAVIEKDGGTLEVNRLVTTLLMENDAVVGVQLADGTQRRAKKVVSDAGALNTVGQLLPQAQRDSQWAREVLSFKPAAAHIGMYLGFEGDILSHGATLSNHWFYQSWDPSATLWNDPLAEAVAPDMFVSFPSLKDPGLDRGSTLKHTAEIAVMTRTTMFERWADSRFGSRPADYVACKASIERLLLAEFGKRFPALVPLIRHHEISTPLTTAHFTLAPHGAIALETTPRRFLSASLNAKTPVPGLHLAGQDVGSPGIQGAMMGGVLAAASIDPKVFRLLA